MIFSIISFKGGTGKTTIASNLAYFFAQDNKKVLLVDLDMQGNLINAFGRNAEENSSLYNWYSKKSKIKDLIIRSISNNIDLLSSNLLFGKLNLNETETKNKILKVLEELNNVYDVILIDTSPHFNALTTDLIKKHRSILVVNPDLFSYLSLQKIIKNINYKQIFIVPNKIKKDKNSEQVLKFIEKEANEAPNISLTSGINHLETFSLSFIRKGMPYCFTAKSETRFLKIFKEVYKVIYQN